MSFDYLTLSLPSTYVWGRFPAIEKPVTKHSSIYKPGVRALDQADDLRSQREVPGFWNLLPYYVGQQTESSCSLATTVMIANAAKLLGALPRVEEILHPSTLVSEDNFFDLVNNPAWQLEIQDDGRGVTLGQYHRYLTAALTQLGAPWAQVRVVYADAADEAGQRDLLARFRADLLAASFSPLRFIALNFEFGAFVHSYDSGHISPVGCYDPVKKSVLVLDVDREVVDPYWVPDHQLLAAMLATDPESGRPRGYVVIDLAHQQ